MMLLDLPNALERFRRDHGLQAEHLALLLGIDERALGTFAAYPLPDPIGPDFEVAVCHIAAGVGCEPDALRYMLVAADQGLKPRLQPQISLRNHAGPQAAGTVRRVGRDRGERATRGAACQAESGS